LRLTSVGNLVLLGQQVAAADSLALIVADTAFPYLSRPALRVDPFYARLGGVPAYDRLIATE
jgi:hypothetical protein